MKVICKLLIIATCCLPVQAFAIEKLSVSELLDRYAANQDRLCSLVAKTEETITSDWSDKTSPKFRRWVSELAIDGKRTHHRLYRWRNLPAEDAPTPPMQDAQYQPVLWDGQRYFEYYGALKAGQVPKAYTSVDEKYAKHGVVAGYYTAPFLGIRYSTHERIDAVLCRADSISVREKLEQVGSIPCYVIDAKTKCGTFTLWIDPEHGYSIAKADIRVGPNEFFCGTRLKDNESSSLSVRNVRFENIDGVWVPMEADSYMTYNMPDGRSLRPTIQHKVTQITLDPDHEALGSFVPDIENGTVVRDLDNGMRYTWQEGMKFVVDEWDGSIRYVPKEWSILVGVGKPLPELEGIKLKLSDEQTKDRAILLCFFDMEQRPSRNCIRQLAQKAAELKEKGVAVVAVQTSQVTEKTLNEWKKKNRIPFPVGMITADIEKTRFTWGVRSLPWLILTDKQHIVTAEGFTLDELNEKLGNNPKHKSGPTR